MSKTIATTLAALTVCSGTAVSTASTGSLSRLFSILSSHNDAPLSKQDRQTNLTDVYAFIGEKYDGSGPVLNVIASVCPFGEPGDGPHFDRFAPDALYSLHITNPVTGERVSVPNRNDPIVRGDLIFTPTFDPQAQLIFTFLGERSSATSPYDKSELQQKLKEIGAKVENQISTQTDYVILLGATDDARGPEIEAEAERAAQYGVTFMTEKELLEFLGR